MKKFLALVATLLLTIIGVQSASATDVEFSFELGGNGTSVEGASVKLSGVTETYVQKLGPDGTARFLVPAGNYTLTLSAAGMANPFSETMGAQQVTAPGAIKTEMPKSRSTTVRFLLPDGSLVAGPWSGWGMSGASVTTPGGINWSVPFATPTSHGANGTSFKVFLPVGSTAQFPQSGDTDGDGYKELWFIQPTANGGTRNFQLPTKTLLNGGDIAVADASFLVFDQTEIRGSANSAFTVTGHVKTYGKGTAGRSAPMSWTTLPFFNDKNGYSATTRRGFGTQAIRADGTFSFTLYLRNTMPYFTSWANGSTYDFPSSSLAIILTTPKATYKNCAALNLDFQGGVNGPKFKNKGLAPKYKSTTNEKLYKAVKKLDFDNDGIACEK